MVDIYKLFHPTNNQYTLFSEACGTFYKTDHILGHKPSLDKLQTNSRQIQKNQNNPLHHIK
jgi:hypothetical protein